MISKKAVIKLLKSGNFTIYYHDNQACSIYRGKLSQEEIEKCDEEHNNTHIPVYDPMDEDGYLPEITKLLTQVLGGKSCSI